MFQILQVDPASEAVDYASAVEQRTRFPVVTRESIFDAEAFRCHNGMSGPPICAVIVEEQITDDEAFASGRHYAKWLSEEMVVKVPIILHTKQILRLDPDEESAIIYRQKNGDAEFFADAVLGDLLSFFGFLQKPLPTPANDEGYAARGLTSY